MRLLFEPLRVGTLDLPNRIMRSATAERMADSATGAPRPALAGLYADLARGGVGLIVTGHCYVDRRGKAHPQMASIADDDVIPIWRETVRPAQELGARVMMQINHSGANCDPTITPRALSPSGVAGHGLAASRAMTEEEIAHTAEAFGHAARRAREAGLDGVQIHGAHGYLVSQFLTPRTNRRTDDWGGDPARRRAFLEAVSHAVRSQVGSDYPVWIKLGVAGATPEPLTLEEGAQVAAACPHMGIDAAEISMALGTPEGLLTHTEANLLPLAEAARTAVGADYPLALVSGFRTLTGMESALACGTVQIISLCRPLIAEPNLPRKLREGRATEAICVRCGRCGPEDDEGIGCHNAGVQRSLR